MMRLWKRRKNKQVVSKDTSGDPGKQLIIGKVTRFSRSSDFIRRHFLPIVILVVALVASGTAIYSLNKKNVYVPEPAPNFDNIPLPEGKGEIQIKPDKEPLKLPSTG